MCLFESMPFLVSNVNPILIPLFYCIGVGDITLTVNVYDEGNMASLVTAGG